MVLQRLLDLSNERATEYTILWAKQFRSCCVCQFYAQVNRSESIINVHIGTEYFYKNLIMWPYGRSQVPMTPWCMCDLDGHILALHVKYARYFPVLSLSRS